MALGATIYSFTIQLSDMDRGVYETLDLRVAQHPSEAAEYMLTRVMAYCLEYQEGITFSKGLADADQPAVWVHDPTGRLTVWIEVGTPTAERLHRASKLAGAWSFTPTRISAFSSTTSAARQSTRLPRSRCIP